MTDEKAPTPEEKREAEALARALDGEAAEAPADALETAALLRASRNAELTDVRARAIRDRIAPPVRHWHWMAPLGLAAATAATLVVMIAHRRQLPARIPMPPVALLAAQADAARPKGGTQLEREMVAYRQQVLSALEARYR